MKQITRSAIFLSLSLCAMAEAGALDLSALKRSDLADVALSLPELRRAKRASGRTKDSGAAETELLVKFRGQKEARSVVVDSRVSAQALKALQARADVEYAEPNRRVQRQFVPSDALLGSQWHHGKIGSTNAWNWGMGSSHVKIAIVDAPFNLSHPDLAGNAVPGWDVVNEVSLISGDDEHASMSAGMAAGVVNNGIGIAGIGNFALIPVNNAYADLSSDILQMDAAIRWAASNGARVVSLSWDGANSSVLNDAARFLRETVDGVVVMAGVNGSGYLNYTNQPHIIAVSMTDSADQFRSRYGPHIDLSAPGFSIYSTTATGYATGSGTSYATPLVAGLFAALFSINPALTAQEAMTIIQDTAEDLGTTGWDQKYGWGRIDFGKAAGLAAGSAGDPVIAITNGNEQVAYETSNYTLGGTNPHVVGSLLWSNSLTRSYGTIPVSGIQFQVSGFNLAVGHNAITVSGTNRYGRIASDQVTITRQTRLPNEAFWWYQRNILAEEGRDYAVANQGQLKWVATQAYQEFEAKLPGGAGSNLTAIASSFVNSKNYAIVNQGQLKCVAKPFYDRLWALGRTNAYPLGAGTNQYPWQCLTNAAFDDAPANIGQLKYLFSFEVE